MGLENIIAGYKLSSDAEERFNRDFIKNIRGTVQANFGSLAVPVLLLFLLGLLVAVLYERTGGLVGMLVVVVYALGTILILWELLSFRIDFDGSTGFVQYHTLLHGTTTYHIDELMMFDVETQRLTYSPNPLFHRRHGLFSLRNLSERFRSRRTLRIRELLYISTAEGVICVPMSSSFMTSKLVRGIGGFRDAEKLYNYLDLYRRYVLKHDPALDDAAEKEDTAISPAVRAAIAAAKAQAQPLDPEQGIPALGKDDFNPAAFASERPQDALLSTPDISVPVTGEPETHILPQKTDGTRSIPAPEILQKNDAKPAEMPLPAVTAEEALAPQQAPVHKSAFPDPARKPPVDVDELFNQVLRQHGKLK